MQLTEYSTLKNLLVGDLKGHFIIPSYQRGYRWSEKQIQTFLDDIWSADDLPKGEYYFLQPIVIRRCAADSAINTCTNSWEVIDGQQRLTTILLIYNTMEKNNYLTDPQKEMRHKHSFSISYKTRPDSTAFLANINLNQALANVDYYHIARAEECILQWLKEKIEQNSDPTAIFKTLRERTRILQYEINETALVDSVQLFLRLNIGKIPLTSAEVLKAWIMSPAGEQNSSSGSRWRMEVSTQWDEMEHALRREEFWGFLADGTKNYDNRIEFLFDLLIDNFDSYDDDPHFTFNELTKHEEPTQKRVEELWERLRGTYQTLRYWYENHNMYHYVGYLVATNGSRTISALLRESSGLTKCETVEHLKNIIIDKIKPKKGKSIVELDYSHDNTLLTHILLLFNVETMRSLIDNHADRRMDPMQRFPFHRYKQQKWSLEHIQAQNVEKIKSPGDRRAWLLNHSWLDQYGLDHGTNEETVAELRRELQEIRKSENKEIDAERFERLFNTIIGLFPAKAGVEMNGIGNLALLGRENNTVLSNSLFPEKRRSLLELEQEGEYIPLCTKGVFLRSYRKELGPYNDPHWGVKDQDDYVDAISEKLAAYLPLPSGKDGK